MGFLFNVSVVLVLVVGFAAKNKGLSLWDKTAEIKQQFENKTDEQKGSTLAKVFNESKDFIKSSINNTVVTVAGYGDLIPSKYYDDINRIINHLDFEELPPRAVARDEVKYYLYTKDRPNVAVSENRTQEIPNGYNNYVFVVHGWRSGTNKTWVENVTEVSLKGDSNIAVIQVDWSNPAADLYAISVLNVREVGSIVGDFIVKLNQERGIDLDRITFIGHSLGAHVSGFAAKRVFEKLNGKVAKIFGLDPAGPLFSRRGEQDRLSRDDARVVVILHTDGGKFGFKPSFGATDFYANTGSAVQPGCLDLVNFSIKNITSAVFCSHARAPLYFMEALKDNKNILGLQCATFDIFTSGGCNRNRAYALLNDNSDTRGEFYFSTKDRVPYIRKGLPLEENKEKEIEQ